MMLERSVSVGDWPLGRLEDEVASLAAHIAAATGRLLMLLAELDRRGAWAEQGFLSLAHWLSWRTGLGVLAAREHVRVARALADLPVTAALLAAGELSFSKVRALTRVARPETEGTLCELARAASAADLERIIRRVRRADPAGEQARSERIEATREARWFFDEDGMLVVQARLAPEEGALVCRALEAAQQDLWQRAPDAEVPAEKRRADALVWLADHALAGGTDRSGADRTQVVVHVDAEVLADPTQDGRSYLAGGPEISAETSRRLACDASVVVMASDAGEGGGAVESGRRTRRVSAALRRALEERDGGTCSFPGCTNRRVDAHHLRHWAAGGPTVLGNLTLACRRHHVLLHEGGFRVEMTPVGPRFFRPDGSELSHAPPPPRTGEDRIGELVRRATRLCLGPWTLAGRQDEPADVTWVADCLVSRFG